MIVTTIQMKSVIQANKNYDSSIILQQVFHWVEQLPPQCRLQNTNNYDQLLKFTLFKRYVIFEHL